MTPTPEQINQALLNYYKPMRSPDARIRDALLHVKQSEILNAQKNSDAMAKPGPKDQPHD